MSETVDHGRFSLVRDVVGNRIGFWSVSGEVVAVDRWTETTVSSSNGAVSTFGNHVTVTPPRVWASTVNRKAVWIRTASSEFQVPVPEGLAVRSGHRVHVVAASLTTAVTGQWSAIVNHDTGRWCQVDQVPPGRVYDAWTSFVMGFGQGTGNLAFGIMCLYAALLSVTFGLLAHLWSVFLVGVFTGLGVGFVHALVGLRMSNRALSSYAAAVKDACNQVFAVERS